MDIVHMFLLLAAVSLAHRGLLTGPSCDDDFGSSGTALDIPDPSISWYFRHYLDCTHRAVWSKFVNPRADFKFYVGIGIPTSERFAHVRADALIVGPDLPTLTGEDLASLPGDIRNDPVLAENPRGYIFRSPEDQSTCNHLGRVMQKHCTVVDGRCNHRILHDLGGVSGVGCGNFGRSVLGCV